ncbi:MAG: cobyric acid synthase, partial [Lachnospiraceae bacterium]|nr:cobyric acid synthase [Lachnospiraceae bacterium]
AYDTLDQAYDIIVIEGAGSPAEINLKQDDIVNMGMAKLAKAPVLLVGDIDRGGVFAQLYGTTELLEKEEKALIKGLIINKFRGDKTILDPGVEMLEQLTGIPVVGVTPYLHVSLEDEDSLSERLEKDGIAQEGDSARVPLIDLAVIRFPRISNFTDFNVFESVENVSVRYVSSVRQLGQPDMILLPGTKNTMRDLLWMRQNGLEAAILKAQKAGTVIFGVCGGYQMLGRTITDAEGVEEGGTIRGMGLLDMDTVFESEKARTRVEGSFLSVGGVLSELSGLPLYGYEIHMGRSRLTDGGNSDSPPEEAGGREAGSATVPFTSIENVLSCEQKQEGAWKGNVYGTYVHGIFDREEVATAVIHSLAKAKGVTEQMGKAVDFAAFKETQYDLLAAGLRANLDMGAIYRILEAGV